MTKHKEAFPLHNSTGNKSNWKMFWYVGTISVHCSLPNASNLLLFRCVWQSKCAQFLQHELTAAVSKAIIESSPSSSSSFFFVVILAFITDKQHSVMLVHLEENMDFASSNLYKCAKVNSCHHRSWCEVTGSETENISVLFFQCRCQEKHQFLHVCLPSVLLSWHAKYYHVPAC